MPSGNDHAADLDRWEAAVAERATVASVRRLRLLSPEGVSTRLLQTRVGEVEAGETSVWLAGARGDLRTGLQRVLTDALGPDRRWYLQWILGRWPRGPITMSLPLGDDAAAMALGIVAPLTPTRVALSESPRPLDREAVSHFKALHAATACAGLSGCRMRLVDGDVDALVGRWEIAPRRVPAVAALLGLRAVAEDLGLVAIEGLSGGASVPAAVTLEVAYAPDPEPRLVLEMGGLPLARLAGLVRAALGEEHVAPLAAGARALAQRTAFRVRLVFDADEKARPALVSADRP